MRSSDWSSDVCSSDLDVSACEPVEKRGFSRIGVTNQCNDGPRRTLSPLTMQTTGAADLIKFPPQLGHTVANHSPVRFNLGFARSTKKAETAALSLQVRPTPHQPTCLIVRSDERRGGKECASTCRDRWS